MARLAGVSIKTVSNVIHDYPYVKDATRTRVQNAIDTLGYQPNLSARGLRSGRTGVIGLAVPALRENYFAELADAVIRAAESRGLSVLVEQTSGDRDAELRVLSGSRPRFLDGLLFSPVALGQDDAKFLEVPYPIVLLGERIFGGPTDHVTMHNTSAARAAVEHLIGIGRRRVAVVGASVTDTGTNSSTLRLRGYRQALEAAGIGFDPDLVRECAHWNRDGGAEATHRLIRDGVSFDAVFALNDSLGLGVLRALREEEIRVPEDVAVIGFDNIDEARFSVPSMSSVATKREELAEAAVALLTERFQEKEPRLPPRLVQPDFTIVARESTGTYSPTHADATPAGASQER
ncbi:LacI family DNA-binding transcriptional regulator [Diaminobutyricimonas aerilata]|uniref:LacI family DNA-binding transcriptional regulator n=1 Tax=Diaminobutyricimonas aerilata TaxID=1162967 RepID=UPI003182F5F1